jgi:hypothetical protein
MPTDKELQKKFKKAGITARKWRGDDYGSWAVFQWGKVCFSGLNRAVVTHYKKLALEIYEKEVNS